MEQTWSNTYNALVKAINIIYENESNYCKYCLRGESTCCITSKENCKSQIMAWMFSDKDTMENPKQTLKGGESHN